MSDIININSVAVNTHETYQFNNNNVFYSLVNPIFLPYYQRVVRKSQEWLDGYDPSFHKKDMFSTRIAEKITNGLTKAVYGKGLIFKKGNGNTDDKYEALNFISKKWFDESNFGDAIKQLIGYTLPLGTGALKINRANDGKLWVEAVRLDYFYFTVDGRKRVEEFTCFIRALQTTENDKDNYFLVEKRYFKDVEEEIKETINGVKRVFKTKKRKPFVEYKIHLYQGVIDSNTMPSATGVGVPYKNLPTSVKTALKREYSYVKFDEPKQLPFNDYLGVELFFNEGGDITNPTLPFGRPLVFSNLTDFMEYDMERSYGFRDLYNSKGIVGIPRSLNQGDLIAGADLGEVSGTGGNATMYSNLGAFSQLNIPGYEVIPGTNPETQAPVITQFEIRAAEHETKQNSIIKSIALNIGVSPKILASYLVGGTQQTDDQIQSEDNSVITWIKAHRQDYIKGMNRIVETVLNHSGYADNVIVSFASDDLLREDVLLSSIEKKLELGLIDIEDAIRDLFPDLDEEQLTEKINKAKFRQEQQNQEQTDLDPFANMEGLEGLEGLTNEE